VGAGIDPRAGASVCDCRIVSREVAGPLDGASELLREQVEAAYRGWTEEECLGRRFPRTAVAGVNNVEQ
jgi:hypothetical protein